MNKKTLTGIIGGVTTVAVTSVFFLNYLTTKPSLRVEPISKQSRTRMLNYFPEKYLNGVFNGKEYSVESLNKLNAVKIKYGDLETVLRLNQQFYGLAITNRAGNDDLILSVFYESGTNMTEVRYSIGN